MTRQMTLASPEPDITRRITATLLDFVAQIPVSTVAESPTPRSSAMIKARNAASKAAVAAGTCALPPGPLGWLTLLPEMIGVWKVQAQLVADISRIYGQPSTLTREQLIYCLFRHGAAQAVRDLVVRAGERFLVRRASIIMLQSIARQVGVQITRRTLTKAVSRWVPVLGAAGVAGYAYYDTMQVAETAMQLFESEMIIEQDLTTP